MCFDRATKKYDRDLIMHDRLFQFHRAQQHQLWFGNNAQYSVEVNVDLTRLIHQYAFQAIRKGII